MAGKTNIIALAIIAVVVIAILAYAAASQISRTSSQQSVVAVQLTDPPKIPAGTQQLLITYSSVELHSSSSGSANQSQWVTASGNGTIDLLTLTNVSQTIANAKIASNSMINIVRFNITSAQIVINGTTYNVTVPSGKINIAITGGQKINSSSSSVLIDLYPTVNAHGSANGTVYMMVPAARAIVVNSNASVKINANVGSSSHVGAGLRLRLGGNASASSGGICIGINGNPCGGGTNATVTTTISQGNNGTEANNTVTVKLGSRISNFLIQSVNYNNDTVSGLLYVMYPVARTVGANTVLQVGSTVGYSCDNTLSMLTGVNANGTATFRTIVNSSTHIGGCPI